MKTKILHSVITICTMLLLSFAIPIHAQEPVDQAVAQTFVEGTVFTMDQRLDGHLIAVGSTAGIFILDEHLQLVATANQGHFTYGLSWSPDGEQLAVANENASIDIWRWDEATAELLFELSLPGQNMNTFAVSWSPDGATLVSMSFGVTEDDFGGTAQYNIWDTRTWQIRYIFQPQGEYSVTDPIPLSHSHLIDWHPHGEPLFITVHRGLVAYIINVETGEMVQEILLRGPYAFSVAWHPAGDIIAIGNEGGVNTYSLVTSQRIQGYPAGADNMGVAWSPNGRYLLANSVIWDIHNLSWLGTFQTMQSTSGLVAVAWSPIGDAVVLASGNSGYLRVEDPALLPDFEFDPIVIAEPDQTLTADEVSATSEAP